MCHFYLRFWKNKKIECLKNLCNVTNFRCVRNKFHTTLETFSGDWTTVSRE